MYNLMKCFRFHTRFSDVKSSPVSEGGQVQPLDLKGHSLLFRKCTCLLLERGLEPLWSSSLSWCYRLTNAAVMQSLWFLSATHHVLFAYFPPSSGSFFGPTLAHSSSSQDSFSSLFLNYYFRPICLSCNMMIWYSVLYRAVVEGRACYSR